MKRIQKSQRTAEVKDNNSQEGKGNVICIFFVIFPYSDRLDRLDLNILWQNIIEFYGPEKSMTGCQLMAVHLGNGQNIHPNLFSLQAIIHTHSTGKKEYGSISI